MRMHHSKVTHPLDLYIKLSQVARSNIYLKHQASEALIAMVKQTISSFMI